MPYLYAWCQNGCCAELFADKALGGDDLILGRGEFVTELRHRDLFTLFPVIELLCCSPPQRTAGWLG